MPLFNDISCGMLKSSSRAGSLHGVPELLPPRILITPGHQRVQHPYYLRRRQRHFIYINFRELSPRELADEEVLDRRPREAA